RTARADHVSVPRLALADGDPVGDEPRLLALLLDVDRVLQGHVEPAELHPPDPYLLDAGGVAGRDTAAEREDTADLEPAVSAVLRLPGHHHRHATERRADRRVDGVGGGAGDGGSVGLPAIRADLCTPRLTLRPARRPRSR